MTEQDEWPARAWALGALGAVAGTGFGLLIGGSEPLSAGRLGFATFLFAAFVALALTLERRRWLWSVGAAVAVGALLALIGWTTAQYNGRSWSFDWPFASALVASLLLLPLFQTSRDLGKMRLPPERVHAHVWADFVIGAVGVLFVGIVLLLVVLIDQLLQLVGIEWIERLWGTDWFGFAVAGAAFGGAAARLRDRAGLLGTLLTVKFTVLAVLAPVLAIGIVLFLGALPFGGLATFWAATGSSTVILLACAVLAVWLVNAVASNNPASAEGKGVGGRVLRGSALVLALCVLPLALIGAAGLWIRVDALGWTPTRLWGVAAIAVAVVWGGVYLWTVVRARGLDDAAVFAGNVRMAVGVAALALLLAVPLVDFGGVSARDQLGRLADGRVSREQFDWAALAFDFGPAGKRAVEGLSESKDPIVARAAAAALKADNRYDLAGVEQNQQQEAARLAVAQRPIRVRPRPAVVPEELRRAVFGLRPDDDSALLMAIDRGCDPEDPTPCELFWQPGEAVAVAIQDGCASLSETKQVDTKQRCRISLMPYRRTGRKWEHASTSSDRPDVVPGSPSERAAILAERAALTRGDVTVRTVTRQQVFVGDKPASGLFETVAPSSNGP